MKVLSMNTSLPAKVLVFRVGEQLCSLPVECVREVVHRPELITAPGQPSVLEGFLNLRGQAYPVIRLRHVFGLTPALPDLYAPLIVVDSGKLQAVFEADELEMVAETG